MSLTPFGWAFLILMALAPVVFGGHRDWVLLALAAGFFGLAAGRLIKSLRRGEIAFQTRWSDLALLAAFAWAVFGVRRPQSSPDDFLILIHLAAFLACFYLARSLSYADGISLQLAWGLTFVGGAVAAFGLIQFADYAPHDWWEPSRFVASVFVNHNHFASYLELLLPMTVFLWLFAPLAPWQRFLTAVSGAVMTSAFVLSCSRGAWLSLATAAVLSFLGFFLFAEKTHPARRTLVFGFACVAVLALAVAHEPIRNRLLTLVNVSEDVSAQMRQAMWWGTWALIEKSPVIGHGLGTYVHLFPSFRPEGLYRRINYAHSEYLQVAAEIGWVGLALLAMIAILLVFRMSRIALVSRTSWKQALALGGWVGGASVAIHSLIDFPLHIPAVSFTLAAIAGLVSGITFHADKAPLHHVRIPMPRFLRGWFHWVSIPAVLAGTGFLLYPLLLWGMADFHSFRGTLAYDQGKHEEAARLALEAAEIAPFRADYFKKAGSAFTALGRETQGLERRNAGKQAVAMYRRTLALRPWDSESMHALGENLLRLGELHDAEKWLYEAVNRDPNNPLYWKHWGELNFLRANDHTAAKAFSRAAALAKPYDFHPQIFAHLSSASYFARVGESARRAGRISSAETAFRIATRLEPQHARARVGLAAIFLDQGQRAEAESCVSGWLRGPKEKAAWLAELAHAYYRAEQLREADQAAVQSITMDPENVLAQHVRWLVANRNGNPEQAIAALRAILSLNRSPVVSFEPGAAGPARIVWEPEMGSYQNGKKSHQGWLLFSDGDIEQELYLPPGKVKLRVTARGTEAKGAGPTLAVAWNGEPLLHTEVRSQGWSVFDIETQVKPGDSLLTIGFLNDHRDSLGREDRNLKVEKVVVVWEALP
jgi:O-antigen ligase/tetratricopeptide (TPR) repeat protein